MKIYTLPLKEGLTYVNLSVKEPYLPTNYFKLLCAYVQGGSNMTGTDLCVNKPHCAAAVRP